MTIPMIATLETVLHINLCLIENEGNGLETAEDPRFYVREFKVGDGVSYSVGSDTFPATVILVSPNGKRVIVQDDRAVRTGDFKPNHVPGGFVGHVINQNDQTWDITQDPDGATRAFSLVKWRGVLVWTPKGGNPNGSNRIRLGRRRFYDHNF